MFSWLRSFQKQERRKERRRVAFKQKRAEEKPSVQFIGMSKAIASVIKEENAKEISEYRKKHPGNVSSLPVRVIAKESDW